MENLAPLRDEIKVYLQPTWKLGFYVLGGFFLFFILWGGFAPIESTVNAGGKVIPSGTTRLIQNQSQEGIIQEILVDNGDHVKEGEVLFRFSNIQSKTQLDNLDKQFISYLANRDRLIAERDEKEDITFDEAVLARQDEPEIANFIANQKNLFEANKNAHRSQLKAAEQVLMQTAEKDTALKAQKKAVEEQLAFNTEYVGNLEALLKERLVEKSKVLQAKGTVSGLTGQLGEINANIFSNLEEMDKVKANIDAIKSQKATNLANEMRDTLNQIAHFKEERVRLRDLQERTEIKAPIDGTVTNLQYHTIGGVIGQGQMIMQIVPDDEELLIEARLNANDVDVVYVGQKAKVLFTAYKAKYHPRISGEVIYVSADALDPGQQGGGGAGGMPAQPFYTVRIKVPEDQLKKLPKDQTITTGMQAQVFIVTGSHTFLEYFLSPIIHGSYHTFREE